MLIVSINKNVCYKLEVPQMEMIEEQNRTFSCLQNFIRSGEVNLKQNVLREWLLRGNIASVL